MAKLVTELATAADDEELRQILRENPMQGTISVSFEREPNYFAAAKVEGYHHQAIITRDQSSGKIVGLGSRSIRDAYVNGSPQPVGYLSQFRIAPNYRAMRRTIARAFAFLRQLHQDGRAPFYFTSIIEDNLPARRLLSAGLPGLPRFEEYAHQHTLAIYCRRKRRQIPMPKDLRLARGSAAYSGEIVACLQRNNARYQLASHWTCDTLFNPDHTPGLLSDDFFLALDGKRVVGCLAAWDQRGFKQSVVRNYAGSLARWRGLANVGARLLGWPILPPPNSPLHHCHASHLAVDDDRSDVLAALVRALYNDAVDRGYSYFMLGLADRHPHLKDVMTSYRHIDYRSVLYLVSWEDEPSPLGYMDDRAPGVEIATL